MTRASSTLDQEANGGRTKARGLLYGPLSGIYDLVWRGITVRRWRAAMAQINLPPGARVLEIGVGTGITLSEYPPDCHVTGVDLSPKMLARARKRVAREGLHNVTLMEMDAQRLDEHFDLGCFDLVVAAFVLSVVPDPAAVLRGMRNVGTDRCHYVVINHVSSERRAVRGVEKLVKPLASRLGWAADFDLTRPLAESGLQIDATARVRKVDLWRIMHLSKTAAPPADAPTANGQRVVSVVPELRANGTS